MWMWIEKWKSYDLIPCEQEKLYRGLGHNLIQFYKLVHAFMETTRKPT